MLSFPIQHRYCSFEYQPIPILIQYNISTTHIIQKYNFFPCLIQVVHQAYLWQSSHANQPAAFCVKTAKRNGINPPMEINNYKQNNRWVTVTRNMFGLSLLMQNRLLERWVLGDSPEGYTKRKLPRLNQIKNKFCYFSFTIILSEPEYSHI